MTSELRPTIEDLEGYDLARLAMTPEAVARLTRPQREARVQDLLTEAHLIVDAAQKHLVEADGRTLAGTVGMFSGGNDSTTVIHAFRHRLTHVGMANTLVGIEETRQYVRDTTAALGLPLIEKAAPRPEDSYEAHVLAHGFPGRGKHPLIYQRIKQRAFRAIRTEVLHQAGLTGRQARVVVIMGRRRTESEKRSDVPELERDGSMVYASPIVNWTKLDLNTYRLVDGTVPRNQVSGLVHMSGECLCGCYAKPGEREMVSQFYPEPFREVIDRLQEAIKDRTDIPEYAKTWGWSADPTLNDASRVKSRHKVKRPAGFMCETCD